MLWMQLLYFLQVQILKKVNFYTVIKNVVDYLNLLLVFDLYFKI